MGAKDAKSLKQLARDGYLIDGEIYSVNFETVPRTTNVSADIQTVRDILPLCEFDSVDCEDGLAALESYQKQWDSNNGMWKDKPLHDWASDYADAFRTFGVYETKPKPVVSSSLTMSY